MPNWKKVIVSGSSAALTSVTASSGIVTAGILYLDGLASPRDIIFTYNNKLDWQDGRIGGATLELRSTTNRRVFINSTGVQLSGSVIAQSGFTGSLQGTASWASNIVGGVGVTSVGTSGTVSGITLTGGTITSTGTITLGGSISGLTNSNLSGTAGITNANLANSSITVGSTAISLGSSATTIAGLSSVTSTTFVGALTGNASTATSATSATSATTATNATNVTATANNSTNETTYLTFVDGATGAQGIETDTALTYNPSTNILTAGTFAGALSGNATTATSATTAGSATTAASASSILPNTVTGIVPVPFMSQKTPGVASYLGGDTILTYNTSTGTLNASAFSGTTFTGTTFSGALSGNATTATTAATASKVITGLVTTDATHYIPYVATNHGGVGTNFLGTVAALTYNPVGGTLTSTRFAGTASYASQSGYTMQFVLATTGSNPNGSQNYRMGAPQRNYITITSGRARIYVPRPGKVRYAHIYIRTNGTLASAGTSTFYVTKNSSVSEVITTSTTAGSVADVAIQSTAISMSVALGDFLELTWTTPAWATTPKAVEANGIIYIENNA